MEHDKYMYVKEHQVLLEYEDGFGYVPIMYECNMINGEVEGKIVADNPMLLNWLSFVRHKSKRLNKKGNAYVYENLYYDQHTLGIVLLLDIQKCNNSKHLINWGRQAGKSKLISEIIIFCTLEMARHSHRDFAVYNIVMGCYNAVTTEKLFLPIKQGILDYLDFFNQLHPESELRTQKQSVMTLNMNKENLEIAIYRNGAEEKYSSIWALGIESSKGRDSLSANVLWLDEVSKSQAFGDGAVFQSFLPFLSSTSGVGIFSGITTADSSMAGYVMYCSPVYRKCIRTWEDVYRNKLINDPVNAEGYKKDCIDFRVTMGENSTEWLTNYMMDYNVSEGKFITHALLTSNNLMRTVIERPVWNDPKKYIVAGLDLSSITDRTVLTIGEAYIQDGTMDKWIFETKAIEIYNLAKTSLDSDEIINDTVRWLNTYRVDILMSDATSMQRVIVNSIINKAIEMNIRTQILPYNFAANNKYMMLQYLETCLHSQKCILPKQELLDSSKEWDLLYKELLNLVKEKPKGQGHTKYYAGTGSGDDTVMSLALANYATTYVSLLQAERTKIEIGKHIFIPKLQKVNWLPVQETNNRSKTWLSIR